MGGLERMGSWAAGGGDWYALSALVHILKVNCRILTNLMSICDRFF
jgi:hypothetical protein